MDKLCIAHVGTLCPIAEFTGKEILVGVDGNHKLCLSRMAKQHQGRPGKRFFVVNAQCMLNAWVLCRYHAMSHLHVYLGRLVKLHLQFLDCLAKPCQMLVNAIILNVLVKSGF